MRLVTVLLLLVVLPTAVLSILAGHSIQARELLLQRRLERSARQHIERVNAGLNHDISSDLTLVGKIFRGTLLAGAAPDSIKYGSDDLRRQSKLVDQIYLFMNPWNFIYPQAVDSEGHDSGQNEELRQQLIRRISLARGQHTVVAFQYANYRYCFTPLNGFPEVYAGFRIDQRRANREIERLVREESVGDIELSLERARQVAAVSNGVAGLEVSDSFSTRPKVMGNIDEERDNAERHLAVGHLVLPFSDIKIIAVLRSDADIRAAEQLEGNLTKWGIFLLAVVIIASSALLILRTVNQAEQARRRSEFVVSMSHDLRTPVASMRVLAESLCAGRVESKEKQREFICSIARDCEKLGDMIERILFFFRQEQGAVLYNMRCLNMGELVLDAVRAAEHRFGGRLEIELTVGDNIPLVRGDADALTKVITNLLDNAVKYGGLPGSTGRVRVKVAVRKVVQRGREWTVISVADRGRGVAATERKKIFRRFYRVGGDENEHVGGIGLGLALCADIVRAHHGRLEVRDADGGGAEFVLYLRKTTGVDGQKRG